MSPLDVIYSCWPFEGEVCVFFSCTCTCRWHNPHVVTFLHLRIFSWWFSNAGFKIVSTFQYFTFFWMKGIHLKCWTPVKQTRKFHNYVSNAFLLVSSSAGRKSEASVYIVRTHDKGRHIYRLSHRWQKKCLFPSREGNVMSLFGPSLLLPSTPGCVNEGRGFITPGRIQKKPVEGRQLQVVAYFGRDERLCSDTTRLDVKRGLLCFLMCWKEGLMCSATHTSAHPVCAPLGLRKQIFMTLFNPIFLSDACFHVRD